MQVPTLVITSKNGMLTIPHRFCLFWQHLSCNSEKKLFISGVIVSVNIWKKDFKKTFVGFRLHAGRFLVECKKYGNTQFLYFDIFIYVSSNFTLDSRSTEYLQCHIGLQLHTCCINFDLVKFRENWVREF